MEQLGLDIALYAAIMADALAELYWRACVDANDVEFVLAPPRNNQAPQTIIESEVLGDHAVWILDFDCCKHISLDKAGVEQAVMAFYKNDPFYPRPGFNEKDQALWAQFRVRFLEASKNMLGSQEAGLPELWVDMVEKKAETRHQNQSSPTTEEPEAV